MSTGDDPPQSVAAVEARFAMLFQSFFQTSRAEASPREVAFLLDRLQPRPGARLIGCDRSILAYGWGLSVHGCEVSVMSGDGAPFDGAVWSLGELGHPADAELMDRLAEMLLPGSRLVIDAGHVPLVTGWAHFPIVGTLTPLGVAKSVDNRRLYTWLKEGGL